MDNTVSSATLDVATCAYFKRILLASGASAKATNAALKVLRRDYLNSEIDKTISLMNSRVTPNELMPAKLAAPATIAKLNQQLAAL